MSGEQPDGAPSAEPPVFHVEQPDITSGCPASGPSPAAPGPAAPTGPDLVRSALAAAKAAAQAKGVSPGLPRRRPVVPRRGRLSGPGRDARDPVLFGDALRRLVEERGWQEPTTNAGVLHRWAELVGPELAEHCRPQSLVDGELVLVAESSAWATQVRLLTGSLLATLRREVGAGVVTKVVVHGPAQPDWRRGPRRVQGRGPRDTYG